MPNKDARGMVLAFEEEKPQNEPTAKFFLRIFAETTELFPQND